MSKDNRTIIDLETNLSEELSWRIKELSDYKTILRQVKDDQKKSLIRGGIVLLYAHWEGFVKQSSEHYFNYVVLHKLKPINLKENFVAICLKKYINNLLETKKITKQTECIRFIFDNLNERANFPSSLPLKTSNLDYEKFLEYCLILGLDFTKFELNRNFINIKLVKNRHIIAHGNFLMVNLIDFEEIFIKTIDLLRKIKTNIINSAKLKKFKKLRGKRWLKNGY
jgi:hypothetical protein